MIQKSEKRRLIGVEAPGIRVFLLTVSVSKKPAAAFSLTQFFHGGSSNSAATIGDKSVVSLLNPF